MTVKTWTDVRDFLFEHPEADRVACRTEHSSETHTVYIDVIR